MYASQALELFHSPTLKLVSKPGEDERDFRIRMSQYSREVRDEEVARLRKSYASKIATLEERLRKAKQAVEREKEQARNQSMQTAISFGATLLGAFTGRKSSARSTIGKATTAIRGVGRAANQRGDVNRAEDTVETLEKARADLQAEFDAEVEVLSARVDAQTEELETIAIKPKKADIAMQLLALTWFPYWQDERSQTEQAW